MRTVVKLSLVLGAVLCLFWGTTAAFQGVPGGRTRAEIRHRMPHEPLAGDLREALALTEEQATAITQIQKDYRMTTGQTREQIEKLEMETYQVAETGNAEAVGQVVLERIRLQKQLEVEEKALQQKIDSILTPEQQDKLKQIREESHERGQRHHVIEVEPHQENP